MLIRGIDFDAIGADEDQFAVYRKATDRLDELIRGACVLQVGQIAPRQKNPFVEQRNQAKQRIRRRGDKTLDWAGEINFEGDARALADPELTIESDKPMFEMRVQKE